MKTRIKITGLGLTFILSLLLSACVDHIPAVEELPSPDVDFKYAVADDEYTLDYYVGAQIKFISTSAKEGDCSWDFGDGSTPVTGYEVIHKYAVTGTYNVKLTVSGVGSLEQKIYISDIQPIVTLNQEDSICEVLDSFVAFNVELPNPEGLAESYIWTFPEGTLNEAGDPIAGFEGKDPGRLKFSHVGSQGVKLRVTLGGRELDETFKNVQVAYNKAVPTLYYAMKGGNIMALKLAGSGKPADMKINPYDMGVKSGQTPLNILYNDQSLYVLDPGRQFIYTNDADSVQGDGRIFVMSKDGSLVETMLTSNRWAFHDPFYGYIDGSTLYYADRNTGIRKLTLTDRNLLFSSGSYPYFVQNATLGYYGQGLAYGSINACFGKIGDVWYWGKTFNGEGILRFKESDILPAPITGNGTPPASGWVLKSLYVKSFVWDETRQMFYFTVYSTGYEGFYACTLSELNDITTKNQLAPYKKTLANGKTVTPITEPGKGEGSSGEFIGICQLALDETDGSVYFGLRSGDPDVKSGLMRYDSQTQKIEYVIEGASVYGVSVNKAPAKLF